MLDSYCRFCHCQNHQMQNHRFQHDQKPHLLIGMLIPLAHLHVRSVFHHLPSKILNDFEVASKARKIDFSITAKTDYLLWFILLKAMLYIKCRVNHIFTAQKRTGSLRVISPGVPW